MRKALIAVLFVPSLVAATPKKAALDPGAAGPPMAKGPSACGVKVLPLAEGNQWTYGMVPAPLPPTDAIKRLSPEEPKSIVITVKSIAKQGADTVVTLEEKTTVDLSKDEKKPQLDEHTITTTITCNAKKFEISPDSFLFAAEPGGFYNLTLDSWQHPKGTSWQLTNGGFGDAEWREDLVTKWTQVATPGSDAKLGSGKLELERRFTPEQPEDVGTKLGTYHAEKLGLITTGRVTLDHPVTDTAPMEMPAGWISTLWIAPNVGVVQALNSYAHMYQLTDAKLK